LRVIIPHAVINTTERELKLGRECDILNNAKILIWREDMAEGRVVQFRCMRCGHEYEGVDDPNIERQCPKCRSNSIRKLRKK
jgi:predicted Zn-ribbon and HTH transcriptional regulator